MTAVNRTVYGHSDVPLILKIRYYRCEIYELNSLHMKVHHQGNKPFKLTQLYLFPPFTNRLTLWVKYVLHCHIAAHFTFSSEIIWLTIFRTSNVM